MKIAFYVPLDITSPGGVEMHVIELGRALANMGHSVHVFSRNSTRQLSLYIVNTNAKANTVFDKGLNITGNISGAEKVCVQRNSSGLGELRFFSLRQFRSQYRNYHIIHTHGSAFSWGILPVLFNLMPYQRFVHTLHGVSVDYLFACGAWLNWRCYSSTLIEGFYARMASRVIAVSQAVKKRACHSFALPAERVTVIPNGFTPYRYDAAIRSRQRQLLNLKPRDVALIFVGRSYDRVKGAARLIEVMNQLYQQYSQLRLIAIPGDGFGDAAWLIRTGNVDHNELGRYYMAADIFVNASLNEGLPLTLIEAMACPLAIVAPPVGGIAELIRHNINGLLTRPDRSDLALRIQQLLNNPLLRNKLAQNAKKSSRNLTWTHIACKTLNLYSNLLCSQWVS